MAEREAFVEGSDDDDGAKITTIHSVPRSPRTSMLKSSAMWKHFPIIILRENHAKETTELTMTNLTSRHTEIELTGKGRCETEPSQARSLKLHCSLCLNEAGFCLRMLLSFILSLCTGSSLTESSYSILLE